MIYRLILAIRNSHYNKSTKVVRTEVPSVCIGNITVGGTGKTPMVENVLGTLLDSDEWGARNIAVLSRGYKRRSKGFQQVSVDGGAGLFGDEPVQIKRKFPQVTVAVDKDRVEGCGFLCHPETLDCKAGRKCADKDFPPAEYIILDDAFQYRKLKASSSIVLVDYSRPVTKDRLLPLGNLRDLKRRLYDADIVVVSKCPFDLDDSEKAAYARTLGYSEFVPGSCTATLKGRSQTLLFTRIEYLAPAPVYGDSDPRYVYSKKAVVFTGIAKAAPLRTYLGGNYKVVRHLEFKDHHKFSKMDFRDIADAVHQHPTAAVITTEKDAQRVLDCRNVPQCIRERLFYLPIRHVFLSDAESAIFNDKLINI